MFNKDVSPKDFLKARRPERFSDSIQAERPSLDRSMLEYFLETLTNRNEETIFENFARLLAEREICPNLLPHTGPTGGGDSKVDSETYPVADSLALGWYMGIGREASSERWAFAFSAKKEWHGKVKSDIAKIAQTNRAYSKAFFISNQYIPDKTRAKVEDDLSKKYKLDVRILDRSWILDRVFEHRLELLAIEELKLTGCTRNEVQVGPLDMQRERELDEVEKRIADGLEKQLNDLQLVNDCIRSAILSRSLESPRTDTEGRFDRAERVASKYGLPHQYMESIYQRAWTTFWWYEDYNTFSELYSKVEALVIGSRNVYDLELLQNLWFLMHSAINRDKLDKELAEYDARTATLYKELKRLRDEKNRPSTSLQAKSQLQILKLAHQLSINKPVENVLHDINAVIKESKGLNGFSLEPLAEILIEMGDILNNEPSYEKLFETILEVSSIRKEEISAAKILLKHGLQQLDANHPYDAIRSLGRALVRLYKEETRHELVQALYFCGCAYERVGLLWAARGTLLAAANIAMEEYWKYGKITISQAACIRQLKWIELQLGRIPHVLAWHETDSVLRNVLISQGYNETRLSDGEIEFDVAFGILMLKTDLWELKQLSSIPDILDALGLFSSAVALRYALGYEEEMLKESLDNRETKSLHDFCCKWRDLPGAEDLAEQTLLYNQSNVFLTSNVLGCRIVIDCDNSSPCIELSESILAALESLLSTSRIEHIIALEPELSIKVRCSDFAEKPFSFKIIDHNGKPQIDIICSKFDHHNLMPEENISIMSNMKMLLDNILGRIFLFRNIEEDLKKLFQDERALERSINFTGSFIVVDNLLGHNPKTSISSWSDPQVTNYPLKRVEAWDALDKRKDIRPNCHTSREMRAGSGEPPEELFNKQIVKHSEMATLSHIRVALWDKAEWYGTAFDSTPGCIPVLAPIFKDGDVAEKIFTNWKDELVDSDDYDTLRVSIIRGIDNSNYLAYRVLITSNYPEEGTLLKGIKRFLLISRSCTMTPTTSRNLEMFLERYNDHGKYYLAAAVRKSGSSFPDFVGPKLLKHKLYVREAWEIGRHDIDGAAIRADDNPIIPKDQCNPPIIELLSWKRQKMQIHRDE